MAAKTEYCVTCRLPGSATEQVYSLYAKNADDARRKTEKTLMKGGEVVSVVTHKEFLASLKK
jgi:hypothetical protein